MGGVYTENKTYSHNDSIPEKTKSVFQNCKQDQFLQKMETKTKEDVKSPSAPPAYQGDTVNPKGFYPPPQEGPGGFPAPGPYGAPYGQNYTPVPVTVQPTCFTQAIPSEPDYLWYSIFVMSCCCLPLGIAAFVYSLGTRDANRIGQHELAKKNSQRARILNHCGLALGIIILILTIVVCFYYTQYLLENLSQMKTRN